MEARSVDAIPQGPQWQYEPKWDGFRCLLFRDGPAVLLQSKSGQDLARYFPEIVEAARRIPDRHFVLDGELVVPIGKTLSFDDLLQRIHPAASRVNTLSAATPALFLAFDLLRADANDISTEPLIFRRTALERFARRSFGAAKLFRLSPASRRPVDAERWLRAAGSGSDGVIAKRLDLPYQSGTREGMQKVKRYRSADCVIGGFRYGATGDARKLVGSVLLGLYDRRGLLHHVGFSSGFKAEEKPALTKRLEALATKRSFTGNAPGGPSRWSRRRSSEWQPVEPVLVVEVGYDHVSGDRFRHGTGILRWRPDKAPLQCTMDQLRQKAAGPATDIIGGGGMRNRTRSNRAGTGNLQRLPR